MGPIQGGEERPAGSVHTGWSLAAVVGFLLSFYERHPASVLFIIKTGATGAGKSYSLTDREYKEGKKSEFTPAGGHRKDHHVTQKLEVPKYSRLVPVSESSKRSSTQHQTYVEHSPPPSRMMSKPTSEAVCQLRIDASKDILTITRASGSVVHTRDRNTSIFPTIDSKEQIKAY